MIEKIGALFLDGLFAGLEFVGFVIGAAVPILFVLMVVIWIFCGRGE